MAQHYEAEKIMAAVFVLTGTDWGRERVRRYAEAAINSRIHGHATIGRLSGNLLTGMTASNWKYFGIWFAIGLVVYFLYGYRNSKVGKASAK